MDRAKPTRDAKGVVAGLRQVATLAAVLADKGLQVGLGFGVLVDRHLRHAFGVCIAAVLEQRLAHIDSSLVVRDHLLSPQQVEVGRLAAIIALLIRISPSSGRHGHCAWPFMPPLDMSMPSCRGGHGLSRSACDAGGAQEAHRVNCD